MGGTGEFMAVAPAPQSQPAPSFAHAPYPAAPSHGQPQPYGQPSPHGQPNGQPQPYGQPSPYGQPQPYTQPQPSPQPQPQLQPQPAAPRPNLDHLWYIPPPDVPRACACCMAPPQTSVATKWMRMGGRVVTRVLVPYCRRCAWHRMWSGHFAVGLARFFGLVFAGGGIAGGVLLGIALTKDGGNRQEYCGGLAFVFMLLGYAAAMLLIGMIGRLIAPVGPQCAWRGDAVVATRGRGRWRFQFKSARFEEAFRGMNRGSEKPW